MKINKWKELTKKQQAWTLIGVPLFILLALGLLAVPVFTLIVLVCLGFSVSLAVGLMMLIELE